MNDDEFTKVLSGCGWLLLITLFGIAIAIGIGTQNFWIGAGVWFSLTITIGGAIYYVMGDNFSTYLWTWGSFYILLDLYAKYGVIGHWWWLFGWLLTAFAHGIVGIYAREQKKVLHSIVAGVLSLASVGAGLTSPEEAAEILNVTEPATTAANGSSAAIFTALTWLLVIIGELFLFAAWVQGYIKTEPSPFIILTLLGLGSLAIATWLSGLRGGWWWAIPWGLAALAIGHASRELNEYYERGAARFGYFVTILCLLLAFAVPGLLPHYLAASPAPLSEVQRAATQLAGAQQTATQAAQTVAQQTALAVTATQKAQQATATARLLGTQQASTQRAAQTLTIRQTVQAATAAAMPLSEADKAATQLAQAVATATAAASTPIPSTPQAATSTPSVAPSAPVAATSYDAAKGWQALGTFLGAAIRSIWGVFHLIMLFLLGYSWFKRGWGGVFLLLLLMFTVWLGGVAQHPLAPTLTHIFSSSPATWMHDMLRFSAERFGHAGWGILFLGMVVSLSLLPASHHVIVMRYRLKNLPLVQRLLGTEVAYKYMEGSGANPLLMTVNTLINPIILIGLFVALWMGLRQATHAGDVPLAAWGIPDLAVPSWKPVWQWPYFALAGVCALVQIVLIPLKRKFNVLVSGIAGEVNAWYILFGTLVMAMFVPAGVIIFVTGQAVVQLLLVPLAGREILREAEEKRRRDEELRHEAERRRLAEEHRRREEILQQSRQKEQRRQEAPKKEEPLWSSRLSLVGMLAVENSQWYLAENGVLFVKGETLEQINLTVQNATALFAFKEKTANREGEVLVIGDGQKVFQVGCTSHDILYTFTLPQKADAFTLNPYRTLLAWLNVSAGLVSGLFLENGREVTFASGLAATPALAFSSDGRYLSIGAPDGRIQVLNIATHQIERTLQLHESSASFGKAIRYLAGRKEGGWLAVYEDKRTVLWDGDHHVQHEQSAPRRRLDVIAYHSASGRLAFGLSEGNLQVFDASLERIFETQVEEKQISWLDFSPDGKTLFVIGNRTRVREVKLP